MQINRVKFFKALGEPIRLGIVDFLLCRDKVCICKIAEEFKRDQSVIFRHIKILEDSGIVKTEKNRQFLFCFIDDKEKIKVCFENI